MLNPINEKLKKMFSKGKRSKLMTQSSTPQKLFSKSFMRSFDKENDPRLLNHLNDFSLPPFKLLCRKKVGDVKSAIKQQDYEKILHDNQELKEKIKTHEQMEEFYLRQLESRRKEQNNLEWRLSVLNEEFQKTSQLKKKRLSNEGQLLSDIVQIARKGMETVQKVEH